MSKYEAVLQHLCKHGNITSLEAITLYGATRLSDIIFKYRNKGLNINSKYENGTDRFGNKTHYVRYELEDTPSDLSFLLNKKSSIHEYRTSY